MSRIPVSFIDAQPALPAPEAVHTVPVPYRQQLMDGWCWAAAIEMIIAALTEQEVAQCTLADYEFQRRDCCPTNAACDRGAPLSSFPGLLLTWGINADRLRRPLHFDELERQLAAGMPVIYNILFEGDVNHTGIAAGTSDDGGDQLVFILDPDKSFFDHWGRPPYGWITYTDLLNGYGLPGNWDESFVNIAR